MIRYFNLNMFDGQTYYYERKRGKDILIKVCR